MKLMRDIYTDTFFGRRVHFVCSCDIMPFDIKGQVVGVSSGTTETLFRVKVEPSGKIMVIGSNTKGLAYEIL